MNIVVHGFSGEEFLEKLILKILKHTKVDYCLFVLSGKKLDTKINIEYLSLRSIYVWADYPIDWNKIAPLDEKIIKQMEYCEVIALKMLDRMESGGSSLSYDQRKNIYLKHLRFWNDFLTRKKIDLFLIANVPHEVFDFIAYNLCKIKKIKIIYVYQATELQDAVFISSDYQSWVRKENLHYINKTNVKNFDENRLTDRLKNKKIHGVENCIPKWTKLSSATMNKRFKVIKYFEFLKQSINRNPTVFVKKVLNAEYMRNRLRRILQNSIKYKKEKELFFYYDKHAVEADLSKKYIYYPLHYQPELTTSPLAGCYVDQIIGAQLISYCLPSNVYLYVKEHPIQHLLGRTINTYKELISLKNTVLISKNFDSFKLIENSLAVATTSSSAGWEAILRGKPILLFGSYYFSNAPNVFPIKTIDDCMQALKLILVNKTVPIPQNIDKFITYLQKRSVEGVINSFYRKVFHANSKEYNINRIAEKISYYLK